MSGRRAFERARRTNARVPLSQFETLYERMLTIKGHVTGSGLRGETPQCVQKEVMPKQSENAYTNMDTMLTERTSSMSNTDTTLALGALTITRASCEDTEALRAEVLQLRKTLRETLHAREADARIHEEMILRYSQEVEDLRNELSKQNCECYMKRKKKEILKSNKKKIVEDSFDTERDSNHRNENKDTYQVNEQTYITTTSTKKVLHKSSCIRERAREAYLAKQSMNHTVQSSMHEEIDKVPIRSTSAFVPRTTSVMSVSSTFGPN